MDLGTLAIDSMIVHEIPAHRLGHPGGGPILSEIESPLTLGLRNYFKERIASGLLSGSFQVQFNPDATSPVPNLVADTLNGAQTLVNTSQGMARHLHECQTGANPAGLLAVTTGSVETNRAVSILKLEREAGVRVRQTTQDGKTTFSMEHLQDLMLTERTRLFKVALFLLTAGGETPGVVSDKQRGYQPKTEVAAFFLERFLGCHLAEDPQVTTKRFFTAAQEFFNDKVDNPVNRARYEIALLAELNSASGTLNPNQFAADHLIGDDRNRFVTTMRESALGQQFEKDTSLIGSQLKRVQMSFEGNISLIATPEAMSERIQLTSLDDGQTRVQFEDRVKDVRGKR